MMRRRRRRNRGRGPGLHIKLSNEIYNKEMKQCRSNIICHEMTPPPSPVQTGRLKSVMADGLRAAVEVKPYNKK